MKSSKIIFWILASVVAVTVFFIGKESLSQPGMERFEGKYRELGNYRNENNTGPIVRIFAVQALDKDQEWMREFGDAQPHTKYGKTTVYYFSGLNQEHITLTALAPYFDPALKPYLIATYEKSPMGEASFTREDSQ